MGKITKRIKLCNDTPNCSCKARNSCTIKTCKCKCFNNSEAVTADQVEQDIAGEVVEEEDVENFTEENFIQKEDDEYIPDDDFEDNCSEDSEEESEI